MSKLKAFDGSNFTLIIVFPYAKFSKFNFLGTYRLGFIEKAFQNTVITTEFVWSRSIDSNSKFAVTVNTNTKLSGNVVSLVPFGYRAHIRSIVLLFLLRSLKWSVVVVLICAFSSLLLSVRGADS